MDEQSEPIVSVADTNAVNTDSVQSENDNEHKPPPLIISNVTSYDAMIKSLNQIAGDNNYRVKSPNDGVLAKSVNTYKLIEKFLTDVGAPFYTYQLKEERTFDVVLHNLHHSYNTKDLEEILLAHGHTVKSLSVMPRLVYDRHL